MSESQVIQSVEGFEVRELDADGDRWHRMGFFKKSDGWTLALVEEAVEKLLN